MLGAGPLADTGRVRRLGFDSPGRSIEVPAPASIRSASVALPMRRSHCLLALSVAALAIGGCGGGGGGSISTTSSTTPTTAALSKSEYIKQGDEICAEVNAAVGSVGSSSSSGSSTSQVSQVGQVADIYTGMVSSLKGLGTPQGGGNGEFISSAEALAKAEGEAKLADDRGDSGALGAAETSATSALTSFQSAAQTYGFKHCSEGPKAPSPAKGSTTTTPSSSSSSSTSAPEATSTPEAAPEAESAPSGGGGETGGATGGASGGGSAGGGSSGGGTGSGGIGPG